MSTEMHLCDGTWDSWIGGADNGFFDYTIDQQTGLFTGTHVYPDFQSFTIFGSCRHPGMGGVHQIEIFEPVTPVAGRSYRYFGIITPNGGGSGRHRAKGKRHSIFILPVPIEVLRRRMSEEQLNALVAGDDWEAQKTT